MKGKRTFQSPMELVGFKLFDIIAMSNTMLVEPRAVQRYRFS